MTEQIYANCLRRMRNWVALAVKVVNVEFPEWELLMAFRVFDLTHRRSAEDHTVFPCVEGPVRKDFERLAQFFNLDVKSLIHEFQDFVPAAVQQYNLMGQGATWLAAWRHAVYSVMRRQDVSRRHPHGVLVEVLQRYGAWSGCTTSGVEQTFSQAEWLLPKRRLRLGTEQQEAEIILHVDSKESHVE